MDCGLERPLHSAVRNGDMEAANRFLREGVDIYSTDDKGMTCFHILMQGRIQKRHGEKYIKKNEEFILMLLEYASKDLNPTKDQLLLRFHAACTLNFSTLVENLLENIPNVNQPIDENSLVWPGYTGLHFAAHRNNKMVEMLITKGADLLIRDAKGVTPLDICIKSFTGKEVHSILICMNLWRNIAFSDGKTNLMDYILLLHDSNCTSDYLQIVGTVAGTSGNVSPLWPGYTTLHLAVHLLPESQCEKIHQISSIGEVTVRDEHGSTPIHVAFRQDKMKFVDILFMHHNAVVHWNIVDKETLSHLHIACAAKNVNMVAKLIASKDNVNIVYSGRPLPKLKPGWTPLSTALFVKNKAVVNKLFEAGARLFPIDFTGDNEVFPVLPENRAKPLSVAFLSQVLIDKNLQQQINDEMGLTLLHIFCYALDMEKIKKLLNEGVNVNARTREDSPVWPGCTALHLLTSLGAIVMRAGVGEAIRLLLDKEARVTLTDVHGNTPVHLALKCSDKDQGRVWARLLIEHQRDFCVNPANKEGLSHFHISCLVCSPRAVDGFLQHGADVNRPVNGTVGEFYRKAPLHLTLDTQEKPLFGAELQLQTIYCLLKHNDVNINVADSRGWTPLHHMAKYGLERQKLLDSLVSKDMDTNKEIIENGETAFEILLRHNPSVHEIELFVKHGARLNSYNKTTEEGYMAMIIANELLNKNLTIILDLLISSPDIAAVDERGRNAIYNTFWRDKIHLSEQEFANIIEKLIKAGCDIHQRDRQGQTPLHLAVVLRNVKAVRALLLCGADINLVDDSHRSPFAYCARPAISEPQANFHPLLHVLILHLRKLKWVKLEFSKLNNDLLFEVRYAKEIYECGYVSTTNDKHDDEIYPDEQRCNDDQTKDSLYEQLKKLKEIEIGARGLTLYDFVFAKGVSEIILKFTEAERDIVGKILDTINYEEFGSLRYLLKLQYRKLLET